MARACGRGRTIAGMSYDALKWLHVLSATLLVGGGFGSAFHLVLATARRQPADAAAAARDILRFDAFVGAPAAVFQLASGAWLLDRLGVAWTTDWVLLSVLLYALVIAVWVPVVVLESRMRRLAVAAVHPLASFPRRYWACFFGWLALGAIGFGLFAAVFWLMLAKRVPFA